MHGKEIFIHNKNGENMKIESCMQRKLICANKEDSIQNLSIIMKTFNIGFLPLYEGNKIIGVVTDRDLVLALANEKSKKSTMESYMTKEIISIEVDRSIEEALKKMKDYKIKRLLVTKKKKVVGILSLSDLLDSDIHSKELLNTIKEIWKVIPKNHPIEPEIDEFYL